MPLQRFLKDVPIRTKLRIIILIISGISVAGAGVLTLTYQWIRAKEQRGQRMYVISEVIGTQAVAALQFEQVQEAEAILASLRADPQVLAAALYRKDGHLFARYLREGADAALIPASPGPEGHHFDSGHVLVSRPLRSGKEVDGAIHIRSDLSDIHRQIWTHVAVLGVLLVISSVAVLILSGWFVKLITDPILHLSEVVQSVGATKDYSARAGGGGEDEVGRLIAGFNDMLRVVQERDAALASARDELEARVRERTRDLEQKESRLVEAQQIAQMGSWVWDPATNKVDWSDELYRIMGALPTRFGGEYFESLQMVHPDDRKGIQTAMETSRDRREPFESDLRIIRPDGSIRYLRVKGKPLLDEAGKTTRLVGTAQDITERMRTDQAIQKLNSELSAKVDEVAAVNRELEGFSYSVSHDLRAPLRAIHGYAQMLQEDYAEKVDGEGKRFLNVISQNTRRMGQLIDNLLDFSKLGRKALAMSEVDLDSLVGEVCDEAKAAAPDRPIEFRIGALPPAYGDPAMLRIVFTNLISNAVKYSKGRNPAVIEIGGRVEGPEHVYIVRDNGVGFEMEYAHKLFGVFQRLHRSEDFEGTGVGLALVQRIIQRHGGRVAAEGRVNEGATLTIALPRPPEKEGRV